MDNSENNHSAKSKEELEFEKLKSEIKKNEEEKRKFKAEADAVNQQLNEKWFKSKLFGKVLGWLIAAVLLVAWIISFVEPLIQTKQEEMALRVKIEQHQIELEKIELEDNNIQLLKANKEFESTLKESKRLIGSQKDDIDSLIKQNEYLAEKCDLTEPERARFTRMNDRMVAQKSILNQEEAKIDKAIKTTVDAYHEIIKKNPKLKDKIKP